MKHLFTFLMVIVLGCKSSEENALSMEGAYKMLSMSAKGPDIDTLITDSHQFKIYTPDYVMYVHVNGRDSSSSFGIGTYEIKRDSVFEHMFFAADDSTKNETITNYSLFIEKSPAGYTQVIPEIGSGENKMKLTEVYETAGKDTTSPIDGTWKLVDAYYITGDDTSKSMRTQYKVYYKGCIVWGNAFTDADDITYTSIGYGTFTMPAANKITESMTSSTFSTISGHNFDLDIEMTGSEGYKQTITENNGNRSVEIYQRMRK